MDTRPEDLIITPVVGPNGSIQYAASSIVSAMVTGGVAILDEGNRMSEKSWASLAPLLDRRRYVESLVAGVKIRAHAEFRFVATMNDDASTFDLPEYIHSRLMPMIVIDFPEADEELAILKQNLPFSDDQVFEVRRRVPADGARRRRAFHGARRRQHGSLRHQARQASQVRGGPPVPGGGDPPHAGRRSGSLPEGVRNLAQGA